MWKDAWQMMPEIPEASQVAREETGREVRVVETGLATGCQQAETGDDFGPEDQQF